jgi:hypothetical protein
MIARARQKTFLRETAFGFVLAAAAAALGLTFSIGFDSAVVFRLVVAGLGLAYLTRLLAQSGERRGRIVTLAAWIVLAGLALWAEAGAPAIVLGATVAIWLARSLYAHSGFTEAALDLGLSLLGMSFAVWAGVSTGSVFLAVWCFFLAAAMHVALPELIAQFAAARVSPSTEPDPNQGFNQAFDAAEAALRRLALRR